MAHSRRVIDKPSGARRGYRYPPRFAVVVFGSCEEPFCGLLRGAEGKGVRVAYEREGRVRGPEDDELRMGECFGYGSYG
jgi:hypothetical protein